jgi:dTDP-4-dehydrorhamnose 3,5-epimerase
MVDGVQVIELTSHGDERGFFREIARFRDFGFNSEQLSHAFRIAGIANGWHIHRYHREMFYVVRGSLRLVLKDCRTGDPIPVLYPYNNHDLKLVNFGLSSTPLEYQEIVIGEHMPRIVIVPAGIAHGYRVLQDTDILYAATDTYERTRNDEGRIAPNFWPQHHWERTTETK